MRKLKDISNLSPKRRLNRLVKYMESKKEKYGIEKIICTEEIAPHAAMLGIATKKTYIIFKYFDNCFLELQWLRKDNYGDSEDEIRVILVVVENEESKIAYAMSFNIYSGIFSVPNKNNDENYADKFYEKAEIVKYIKDTSNLEKYILDIV